MRLVVDASVAVKWLIAEEGSDAAHGLAASGDDLYAPRLMASEIANALWRKARLGGLPFALSPREPGSRVGGGGSGGQSPRSSGETAVRPAR